MNFFNTKVLFRLQLRGQNGTKLIGVGRTEESLLFYKGFVQPCNDHFDTVVNSLFFLHSLGGQDKAWLQATSCQTIILLSQNCKM